MPAPPRRLTPTSRASVSPRPRRDAFYRTQRIGTASRSARLGGRGLRPPLIPSRSATQRRRQRDPRDELDSLFCVRTPTAVGVVRGTARAQSAEQTLIQA